MTPKSAGRAKGGRRKASPGKRPRPRKTHGSRSYGPRWHRLTWCRVRLAFRYQPNTVGGYYAHLEVRVMASPEGRPIPVTDTGYRSHFMLAEEVEEAGGATAYLRHWLDREAQSAAYQRELARWRQPDLFGAK